MKLQSIIGLLPSKYRHSSKWMIFGILVRAILDFTGVAALLSVLLLLLSNEVYHRYMWLAALAGVLFMVIKNGVSIWLDRRQNLYLLSLYRYFSLRLMNIYYKKGLLFIRKTGAATLTYEVNYVCYTFVLQVLAPLLRMVGEAVLLGLLLAVLFVCFPVMTAWLIICFIPVTWGYMQLIRKRLTCYGERENQAKHRQWRIVEELFRGYAEVETYQAYNTLRKRFEKGLDEISLNRVEMETYGRLPAALIDTGIAIALLILILTATDNETLKVTLGIFGIAAFRILPGLRSLSIAWIQIRNNRFAADTLINALSENNITEQASENSLSFTNEIKVHRLSFAYDNDKKVIKDFSFRVKRGECVGIQGVSGVGKSTLFNLLLGFFPPESGEISIDNKPLTVANRQTWQRIVAYVPQDVFIMEGTVMENIVLNKEPGKEDRTRIISILEQVCLHKWVKTLPDGLETLLGENGCRMSGGQKQRIGIARALYKGAKVLFFDEATSSLDSQTEEEIIQVIKKLSKSAYGLTLLMIAHRESSLQICDRIIQMKT